jgi:flagellar protein FlaG
MEISTTPINQKPLVQKSEVQQKQKLGQIELDQPIPIDIFDESKLKSEEENDKKAEELTKKETTEMVKNVNEMVKLVNAKLEFSVHEETDRIMIRVVDTQTKDLIKEIPPEKVLNASAKFRDMLHLIGILMDEKA